MEKNSELLSKLDAYKNKLYKKVLFRRVALSLGALVLIFLLLNSIEHSLWMSSNSRLLFLILFVLCVIVAFSYLFDPLTKLFKIRKGISNEEAAKGISSSFPSIQDRLLNTLQLMKNNNGSNELLSAAIQEKSLSFNSVSFAKAVDFSVLRKYFLFLVGILAIFFLIFILKPKIFTESTKRIVNYNQTFEKPAPFSFHFVNTETTAFKGEDFKINFKIEGDVLPEDVYIVSDKFPRVKITPNEEGIYEHTINSVQRAFDFQAEASGFFSEKHTIKLVSRPDLLEMNIRVKSPWHTGGEVREVKNTGNLRVKEGSVITWNLTAQNTKKLSFDFDKVPQKVETTNQNLFVVKKQLLKSGFYEIKLSNEHSDNLSNLKYNVEIIKDEFPKIDAEIYPDTINFDWLIVFGIISDDYGFKNLNLFHRKKGEKQFQKAELKVNKKTNHQKFFKSFSLDSLKMNQGDLIEYYVSVRDNDQVNGFKESKTRIFQLKKPSSEEMNKISSKRSKNVEKGLKTNQKAAKELSQQLEKIKDRIRSTQKVNWQEKKMIKEVLKEREQLEKKLDELDQKHQQLKNANEKLNLKNKSISEKSKKLQELINELKDKETMKLYEELKKDLEKNKNTDAIQQKVDKLNKKEKNLERELERTLELFKRLKMESELAKNMQKLDKLIQKQEKLATENAPEEQKKQEEINKEFEGFQKKMQEVKKMNEELKKPNSMKDFTLEQKQIQKDMQQAKKELEEEQKNEEKSGGEKKQSSNKNSKSNKSQKKAAEKMKSLAKKMNKMQGGMEMEMMQASMEQLRDILDNLLKLSFNQEQTMKSMRSVSQSDPRFLELSQAQLKIKDDAKVIEDSLIALSKNMVQLSTFVTREVNKINEHIDKAVSFIKSRQNNKAAADQQFAMTSINNLALMLSDVMNQMQMSMSEATGKGKKKGNKPKPLPQLGEMQKKLGEKMGKIKKSGKKGKELSKDLAQMAAEQEQIRRELERIKDGLGGKPGGKEAGKQLKQAIDQMKQNEIDLVNKQLTNRLIQRQKQITTRMLEAEKATRDQKKDKDRESNTGKKLKRGLPPSLEKYLKQKKSETEFLKTIPLELNPFYKKESKEYFKRLNADN